MVELSHSEERTAKARVVWFASVALIYCLLLAGEGTAQRTPAARLDDLAGPVRSVRVESVLISGGESVDTVTRIQTTFYDRQRRSVGTTLLRADGSIEHEVRQTYDDEGRQLGWWEFYGDGTGAHPGGYSKRAVYKYDSEDRLAEIVVRREGELAHRSVYSYDEHGRKLREQSDGPDAMVTLRAWRYDARGNIVEESQWGKAFDTRTIRAFDERGNIVAESHYNGGVLAARNIRTYDAAGKIAKQIGFGSGGAVTGTIDSEYNDRGDLIKSIADTTAYITTVIVTYDAAGRIERRATETIYKGQSRYRSADHDPDPGKIVIRYGESGRVEEETHFDARGVLRHKSVSVYDGGKRLTARDYFGAGGTLRSRQSFVYDGHGNRIETRSYDVASDGTVRLTSLERRGITYY